MKEKAIKITFDMNTGNCNIDGENFVGPECEKATAAFEEALGAVTVKTRKPDYIKKTVQNQNQKAQ